MASKMLRRSGVSVGLVAERVGFLPDWVVQVGLGLAHAEIDVLLEEWPNARWISFEPYPVIIKKSQKKLHPRASIRQVAISNYMGEGLLHIKTRHKDGASLYQHATLADSEPYTEVKVDVCTLDSQLVCAPGAPSVLLWLDCEESEYDALQGAEEFISCVGMVNVEMTSRPSQIVAPQIVVIHNYLTRHGFYRQWCHSQRGHCGQFDAIYVRKYLFRPEICMDPWEIERAQEEGVA
jgi:FkbM family methyltransferase